MLVGWADFWEESEELAGCAERQLGPAMCNESDADTLREKITERVKQS